MTLLLDYNALWASFLNDFINLLWSFSKLWFPWLCWLFMRLSGFTISILREFIFLRIFICVCGEGEIVTFMVDNFLLCLCFICFAFSLDVSIIGFSPEKNRGVEPMNYFLAVHMAKAYSLFWFIVGNIIVTRLHAFRDYFVSSDFYRVMAQGVICCIQIYTLIFRYILDILK